MEPSSPDELELIPTPTPMEQAIFALKIATIVFCLVWIYRDARARDADPLLWTVALAAGALFIHWAIPVVGLGVYFLVRPKGKLDRCPHCGSGHIEWFTQCPKCEGPLKRDCPRCKTLAPYEATECPECGANL